MVYLFNVGKRRKKKKILPEKTPVGWKFEGKLIPPQCFSTLWMSGDNYKENADKFDIKNYKDFSKKNPGEYFEYKHGEMTSKPIQMPSWGGSLGNLQSYFFIYMNIEFDRLSIEDMEASKNIGFFQKSEN